MDGSKKRQRDNRQWRDPDDTVVKRAGEGCLWGGCSLGGCWWWLALAPLIAILSRVL